jgi:hypothetical protein
LARNTLFVNFFGGPGVGKSVLCAGLYATLSFRGFKCEEAKEYAKECVHNGSVRLLEDQVLVAGRQRNMILSLDGLYDVVVTDSPYILGRFYGKPEPLFLDFLLKDFSKRNQLNVFVERSIPYEQAGRVETPEQAKAVDRKIEAFFSETNLPHIRIHHEQRKTLDYLADIVEGLIKDAQAREGEGPDR